MILHRSVGGTANDVVSSQAPLILGSDGNLYGTSDTGGVNGQGSVFKATPAGDVTTLYSFSPQTGYLINPDGIDPKQPLVQDPAGNLYGTTPFGGPNGTGIIFKIAPDGTYTKMHAFDGLRGGKFKVNYDGAHPHSGLVLGPDGNFYGTAYDGGAHASGTIFRITSGRVYTTIKSFSDFDKNTAVNADGVYPVGPLILGQNGNFYGATFLGGTAGNGTLFEITPGGVFENYRDFAGRTEPIYLQNAPIQGRDGNFYLAMPPFAELSEDDAIFKITPDGVLTTLHRFDDEGTDGFYLSGPLVQAPDGNFYGMTGRGGANSLGTIFRVDASGDFATLFSFSNVIGSNPNPSLTLGNDGRLYGILNNGTSSAPGAALFAFPIAPFVTGGAITTEVGRDFSYQITAINTPTSYRAPGLPPGLTFNTKTGLIKGTPTKAGTYNATLQATNVNGTGSAPLVVTVQAQGLPLITSPATASGARGQPFSYQITADYGPTHFAAAGLPAGLHIDTTTGLISGTPTGFATFHVALKAGNAQGTSTQTLTLTIARS